MTNEEIIQAVKEAAKVCISRNYGDDCDGCPFADKNYEGYGLYSYDCKAGLTYWWGLLEEEKEHEDGKEAD
jgi:hypothetical protein